jgi:hypothetical protein
MLFAMAVSPEDLAAGAAALSQFVANAKYAEMIVDIAFVVVPTILGFGAAGLIGSAAIRTAKDVMNSISMLATLQPSLMYGKEALGPLNAKRKELAEKWQQSDHWLAKRVGIILAPIQWYKSRKKRQNDGGGGG